MRLLRVAGVSAMALCLALAPAHGQSIGAVELVEVWAYGTPPGAARQDRFVRDTVVQQEKLETVENGSMHLRFADGTVLRLGSNSEATLDTYVYDAGTNAGQMSANLTRGAFRFISGQLSKDGVQLRTPTALIGIRGTDFIVTVIASLTIVSVISGIVTVTNANGGASTSVSAGQSVSVAANSTAAPAPTVQDVMDPGISDPSPGPTGPGTGTNAGTAGGGGDEQGSSGDD